MNSTKYALQQRIINYKYFDWYFFMENLILIVHVIVSLAVIGLVLIQHGKGADAGAAFGGGNSGSVFGVQGSSNFLTRATSISVTLFFCTSIALAFIASNKHDTLLSLESIVENSGPLDKNTQDLTEKESVSQDIPN
jgi:preprotein translocase subunit SecG